MYQYENSINLDKTIILKEDEATYRHHAKGGDNTENNLITVCTVCHDEIHRKKKISKAEQS